MGQQSRLTAACVDRTQETTIYSSLRSFAALYAPWLQPGATQALMQPRRHNPAYECHRLSLSFIYSYTILHDTVDFHGCLELSVQKSVDRTSNFL